LIIFEIMKTFFSAEKESEKRYIFHFTIILFILAHLFFINNDFWQDEIYTLVYFVFESYKTILTNYQNTNNHILFNFLIKTIGHGLGIRNLLASLEQPYILRLILLCITLITLRIFYKVTSAHYGRSFAETSTIILCTTIVYLNFAVQLRGYSLSILFIIWQFSAITRVLNSKKLTTAAFYLFLSTLLALLCIPTNLYLTASYFIFCALLTIWPGISNIFFQHPIPRRQSIKAGSIVAISTIIALLYYKWLLNMQLENPIINTTKSFGLPNILQAPAIFYHFVGYRIYFYLVIIIWMICYRNTLARYSKVFLPLFCFFIPFTLYFIHGPMIIPRIFVPLIPFFVWVVAAMVEEINDKKDYRIYKPVFHLFNVMVFIISLIYLDFSSKKNNKLSIHQHDLRNHYYLINFNAKKITLDASNAMNKDSFELLVRDDHGTTGIYYYLNAYQVPYRLYEDKTDLSKPVLILTNNKNFMEKQFSENDIPYVNLSKKNNEQYSLYRVGQKN
jgi:hypothetical protein